MITSSSARQVQTLIADLASTKTSIREAAIARLRVVGARAVEAMLGVAADADAPIQARQAALHVLEGIRDPRALDVALALADDRHADVAVAAIGVARALMEDPRGLTAVDRLTSIALERTRPTLIRLAAIAALSDLEPSTVQPLYDALVGDPDTAIAAAATSGLSVPTDTVDPSAILNHAIDHELPADAVVLARVISTSGATIPPARLHQLLERIRDCETAVPAGSRRGWTVSRGAVHLALARQGSRLGVYDLREALAGADTALPVEFLTAVGLIGDALCLEALAEAYAHTLERDPRPSWGSRQISETFHRICKRERVTKRSAIYKRIEKRWPQVLG